MKISRPVRIKRTYTQTLVSTPEKVFHLLCPVREMDWVNGWHPELVISDSGYVEKDCVFIMPDRPENSIWLVTEWNPEDYYVEFLKVTPGLTVGYIEIRLREAEGNRTHARISYEYTALSQAGEDFVEKFTQESYDAFMKEWELALNHYLVNGEKRGATKR